MAAVAEVALPVASALVSGVAPKPYSDSGLCGRCCSEWRSMLNLCACAVSVICLVNSLFAGMFFFGFIHTFLLLTNLISAYYLKDYAELLDLRRTADEFIQLRTEYTTLHGQFETTVGDLNKTKTDYEAANQEHMALIKKQGDQLASLTEAQSEKIKTLELIKQQFLDTSVANAKVSAALETNQKALQSVTHQLETATLTLQTLLEKGGQALSSETAFLQQARRDVTVALTLLHQQANGGNAATPTHTQTVVT